MRHRCGDKKDDRNQEGYPGRSQSGIPIEQLGLLGHILSGFGACEFLRQHGGPEYWLETGERQADS